MISSGVVGACGNEHCWWSAGEWVIISSGVGGGARMENIILHADIIFGLRILIFEAFS